MDAAYDKFGIDYVCMRQPDPRIAARIEMALGDAQTVLNVGAGTGSYEPTDRDVTALEPSIEMIRQRPATATQVIQGKAEALPFADNAFDAAMAVLTVHHWSNPAEGLTELRRVSRGPVVILTYDPAFRGFWLADYVPGLVTLDDDRMPPLGLYCETLGQVMIVPVPIPYDCTDGFLCAYWRRPSAYLDPRVRAAMSSFHLIGDVSHELLALEADLGNGDWARRYGHLLTKAELDLGYRLVVAR